MNVNDKLTREGMFWECVWVDVSYVYVVYGVEVVLCLKREEVLAVITNQQFATIAKDEAIASIAYIN